MLKKLLIVSLVLFSQMAFSEQAAMDELLQNLHNLKSMKANFKQVIIDGNGKSINESSGSMALERPEKFRWYTHQPARQVIVVVDDKMSIYDIDLEQLTINKVDEQGKSVPAILLGDSDKEIENAFSVSVKEGKSATDRAFTLTPKNNSDDFVWVKFIFNKGKLIAMQFKDKMDQKTVIEFKNIQMNKSINPVVFQVKHAAGVDVIDNYSAYAQQFNYG